MPPMRPGESNSEMVWPRLRETWRLWELACVLRPWLLLLLLLWPYLVPLREPTRPGNTLASSGFNDGMQAQRMAMLHSRPDQMAISMPLTVALSAICFPGCQGVIPVPGLCGKGTELYAHSEYSLTMAIAQALKFTC